MPGTIQVSVLEFVGLPSSSPPSSITVKVLVGKKEYQILGKGEFSFPLTTLRENLIIMLLDAEGNLISETGVRTLSVIEKGSLEDMFRIEVGGHVHMRLQFRLSQEDRDRIRKMRESALKKKYGESFNSSVRCSGTAAVSSDGAAALNYNHEVSGVRSNLSSVLAPGSKEAELHVFERGLVEKIGTQSPVVEVPKKTLSEAIPSLPGCSKTADVVANNVSTVSKHKKDKRELQEKVPNNVRKMISSFETNLVKDIRSPNSSSSSKFQFSKTLPELFENPSNTWAADQSSKNVMNNFSIESQQNSTKSDQQEQFASFRSSQLVHEVRQLELTAGNVRSEGHTGFNDNVRVPSADTGEKRELFDDVMRTSIKSVAAFERNANGDYANHQSYSLPEISMNGYSRNRLELEANFDDIFGLSDLWIFPDEGRHQCITTGGHKAEHQYKRGMKKLWPNSLLEQDYGGGSDIKVNRTGRTSDAKLDSREYGQPSGAAAGQALKIAIMVGFGALVLLTGQR